ncbi:MAG: DUF4834 family protein [Vicingaceae bacterium]
MIVEAGLISLLRTLLIFVAVYFAFRLIFRVLVPYLLKRFIKKQEGRFYQNFNSNADKRGEESTGEVNIKGKQKKSHKSDQLGDYVDYEEVSENEK